MAIVVLAVAIIRLPISDMRAGFEFAFRCGAVFLFAAALYEVNKWAGLFLLLALFSHTFPVFYITEFKVIQTRESYLALNWVIVGCGFYALIVFKCAETKYLLTTICIIGLINTLFLIIHWLGGDPYRLMGLSSRDVRCGITANPNESGTLMALCLPAFFRGDKLIKSSSPWMPRWYWLSPFIILGVVLSKAFGGVLGSSLAIIIFAGIHGHKLWPTALILISSFLYYRYVDQPNIDRRLYIWHKALSICTNSNPIIGCGLGNWKLVNRGLEEAGQYTGPLGWIRLHNSFIQGYVEMGVGFIVVIFGYLGDIAMRARRNFREIALPLSALGAVAGTMTANSVFRMNAINAMIIITWLAILEIKLKNGKEVFNACE